MSSISLNSFYLPPSSSSSSSSSSCCSCNLPLSRKLASPNYCASSSSSSSSHPELTTSNDCSKGASVLQPIVIRGDPPTYVSAPARRIVAVGDLHGDVDKAREALEIAGVLSCDGEEDLWVGGQTVLVQVGDILDRGEDEIAILSLLRSLDVQAKAQGGAVFQVNGNHETMNVEGDFRFVDSGGFDECADFLQHLEDYQYNFENAFLSWIRVSKQRRENQKLSQNYWDSWNLVKRQKGVIARSILLKPGGPLACELARHPVILRVNDWIFCHGGLLPHHVSYGIERMNWEVAQWMKGESESDSFPFIATRGYDSVVWNRLYSRDASQMEDDYQILSILEETLQRSGARGMVVGHTPQISGVNCKYNCSVWRIDVGMSSGVLNSTPEVLEIRNDKARVIKSAKDPVAQLQAAEYT